MQVYIANFGRENYEWPECLARGTIATMNGLAAQQFWENDDREGYIRERLKGKTAAGLTPTIAVASRWYNLMTVISKSSGDIWIHREKDQLWWTTSQSDRPAYVRKVEPTGEKREVIVCHKSCEPWSDRNRKGNRLDWNALHVKAREFLFTESTLQKLGDDNADYALALIGGDDLNRWHSRSDWRSKEMLGKRGPANIFNAKQLAVARMVMTACGTVASANGQEVLRTMKEKNLGFVPQIGFERYVLGLLEMQENLCAITGLALQFDGDADDHEMLCSLDRIDSDGHYEPGNLQVVCRFANRWKGSGDDGEFRRLICAVRAIGAMG